MDARIHSVKYPGNGDQQGGPDLAQVFHDGFHRSQDAGGAAQINPQENLGGLAETVGPGQNGQGHDIFIHMGKHSAGRLDIGGEVAVAEENALGISRSPGRINQGGDLSVMGFDGRHRFFLAHGFHGGHAVVPVSINDEDFFQGLDFFHPSFDFFIDLFVDHKQDLHPAVFNNLNVK